MLSSAMTVDTVTQSHINALPVNDQKDMEDAWNMFPILFRIMDSDQNGTLDLQELLNFLRRFTAVRKNVEVNPQRCIAMAKQVDKNSDRVLDPSEFVMFMMAFAKEAKCSIFELTYFMMEAMGEKVANPPKSMCPQKHASQKSMFDRFMGTLQQEEMERSHTGEKLHVAF